jgi:hypothetical protein
MMPNCWRHDSPARVVIAVWHIFISIFQNPNRAGVIDFIEANLAVDPQGFIPKRACKCEGLLDVLRSRCELSIFRVIVFHAVEVEGFCATLDISDAMDNSPPNIMKSPAHPTPTIVTIITILLLGLPGPLRAADPAGRWKSEFETQAGQMKYTYELRTDAGKVTGLAIRDRDGEMATNTITEGKITGDDISFVEQAKIQDQDLRIEYAGKIAGDEMKLTRKVGDFGTSDIVAKREKETPAAVTIAGKWQSEFDTQIGRQKYLYDFKLDGNNLTGTAAHELNDEKAAADIKGKVAGSDISFNEPFKYQDQVIDIVYSGKITGDEIKFTRKVGDFATEDLIAHRVKEPAAAAPASAMNGGSIIRIDAGSPATFKDADGNIWLADTGFTDGDTVERGTDLKIQNTPNPGLYMTEHYSMTGFSYAVPNGKYMVNLHFAETYEEITGPGQRVFSFTVQGKEFKDFDVWAKAGSGLRAYVEKVPVTVTNGKVQITFTENVQSPEINAIEIIPQP